MGLEKFTGALDSLKGFDVNLFVGEEVYKGKLLGVESDHVVLETDMKYIFYYRIDKIQAITKNTKDFKAKKSKAHFQQTQSLMELLNSFQNTWVSILSIHKQRFNGVLAEVDSDFVTLINGEERILLKLDYVSNILKGFIKEEENKEEKNEKAESQSKDSSSKSNSEKDKNDGKSEKKADSEDKSDQHSNKQAAAEKTDNKTSKADAAAENREHKSDKQAYTHHPEQGKSEKKAKHEDKGIEKHQQVTVAQHTNIYAGSSKDKSKSPEKASKSNMEKKGQHESGQKDQPKDEPKLMKPKPLPTPPKEAMEKDKPKKEANQEKQKETAKSEAPQTEKYSKGMVVEKNNTSYVWKPISQVKKSLRFAGEPAATNDNKDVVIPEVKKEKLKSQAIADKPTKTENARTFPFGGEFKAFDNNKTFPFAGEPPANETARAFPFAGFPNKEKKTSGFLNF
ncbi:hypothetical protein [Bacillus sp. FJAT-29814]|uniref:hypothetical protein n=1 Tax=Bacillus sp. FJAT-29814 TaxID=1729688 RepID=UPI00083551C2|nr:hypothetical protein [Bacillus sp. FJAT-29814]